MPPKDKKEKPKEKPKGWNFDPIEMVVILLFLMVIFGTILPAIWNYIISGEFSFFGFELAPVFAFFKSHVQFFKALGFVIAGGAAIGTFIFNQKGDAVWREEKAKLYPANTPTASPDAEPIQQPMANKWQEIITHAESEVPSNWRLAIIEADIMLDDLLDQLHLPGDTIGDKLKAVEKSDFITIDQAWEAHKVRNMIAHEGSNFLLNQHETRRIISLYGAVFKEFGLI